jgi:16S rRNA (uracil1498-N3)-methyltransferase
VENVSSAGLQASHRYNPRVHRFYAPALAERGLVDLPEDESQHLARVLRLREGDLVGVFDGKGREAMARVVSMSSRRVSVEIVEPRAAAQEPRIAVTLAQALLKSDKMDRVIRDAVMLGVAALQPFVSRRTDVPMKASGQGGRKERWDRTVIASVKQSGRAVVPPVHPTIEFRELLRSTAGRTRLMLVEPAAAHDVANLNNLEGQRPSEATIIVGPEGGFDEQEIDAARADGVTLLSFGSRVLRADAAAVVVMPVLRYVWRDL